MRYFSFFPISIIRSGISHVYHVHESFFWYQSISARCARLKFIVHFALKFPFSSVKLFTCTITRLQKEFIDDERNAKRQRRDYNKLYWETRRTTRSSSEQEGLGIQLLDDTFIHLLEDLLSSAALHRLKEQFFWIWNVFFIQRRCWKTR